MSRARKQARTRRGSLRSIVASKEFARGFAEVRRGMPFNPGPYTRNRNWEYERGRAFGFIAGPGMPLRIGHTLNPKALRFAALAFAGKLLSHGHLLRRERTL
jgi:hypothetical protein